jgi:hypothetical protein
LNPEHPELLEHLVLLEPLESLVDLEGREDLKYQALLEPLVVIYYLPKHHHQ